MLKANELRTGNYVEDKTLTNPLKITANGIHYVELGQFNVYPIPFTEEWLKRAGYSELKRNEAGVVYGFVINGVFDSVLKILVFSSGRIKFRGKELKHVHTFQNLHFALTGEELTFDK